MWRAWIVLSEDRPRIGMDGIPGRIPWRDMVAWADRHGQDSELLQTCLWAMDTEALKLWAAQRKATP